jgi:hypothetical protein
MQPLRETITLLFFLAFDSDLTLPEATMSWRKSITGEKLDRERIAQAHGSCAHAVPIAVDRRSFATDEGGVVRSLVALRTHPSNTPMEGELAKPNRSRPPAEASACRRLGQVLTLFPYLRAGPN